MKDLLKDAIADAKAVRETALANAKLALEEAFTPRIQSMLSAKLSEELEDDDMYEGDEEEMDVEVSDEPTAEPAPAPEMESEPAPAPAPEMEPEMDDDDMNEYDDLDLEEIIRELEGSDDEGMPTESEDMYDMDESDAMDDMNEKEEMYEEDEDIDINEIIRALKEEDDDSVEMHKEESKQEDLEEAYNVIRFLKSKINEVNLLNAKLLYSNKLFRNFVLAEGQKMKVIENFDRAHNLREVKLVYSTLAESFKSNLGRTSKKIVKESFASKPVASTKPAKQVLNEGSELAERFKKLAGLIK